MAIFAGIRCDKCGDTLIWKHVAKQYVVIWARERGWSIGKENNFCPLCRTKRRSTNKPVEK